MPQARQDFHLDIVTAKILYEASWPRICVGVGVGVCVREREFLYLGVQKNCDCFYSLKERTHRHVHNKPKPSSRTNIYKEKSSVNQLSVIL